MQIYSALVEASTISVALQDTLNQVFVYVAQIEYSPATSSKKTPFFSQCPRLLLTGRVTVIYFMWGTGLRSTSSSTGQVP